VNIVYDQGSMERTDEVVDPTQVVPVTTQKSVAVTGNPVAKAAGVPGTVSNTAGKAAPDTAVAAAQQSAKDAKDIPVFPNMPVQSSQSQQEESSTYAVSKHLTHEVQGPGRIVRVTAAVLVNDRAMPGVDRDGQSTVWRPRTADEMTRLEELAQAAIGFDTKRGDSVVMQNISFESNVPEVKVTGLAKASEEAQGLLRAQPELLREVCFGLLAVMLVLFVVRPVAKQVVTMMQEPKMLPGATVEFAKPMLAVASTEEVAASESAAALPAALDRQAVLEQVGKHIRTAPMQSTRLLEAWIQDAGERA